MRTGDSGAEIARRLGKPASLITEVGELAQAPAPIRKLHDDGRCRDVRSLYLLARTHREHPEAVAGLLGGDGQITRDQVEALAAKQRIVRRKPTVHQPPRDNTCLESSGNELMVEVDGQEAIFDVDKRPSKTTAEVRFADGSRHTVELARLRLIAWREGK